jgi:hypothetical protein
MVSEMNAPEITMYPYSGGVGVFGRAPGSRADGWDDEEPPAR